MNVRTSTKLRRDPESVRSARAFVNHALRSGGAPADIIDRLELAVAEACNNAILHSGSDVYSVSISVDGGRATVTVADDGDGFDPPRNPTMPAPRATGRRGLAIMRELVEHVDLTSTPAGTTVQLTQTFTPGARSQRTAQSARAARATPLIVET